MHAATPRSRSRPVSRAALVLWLAGVYTKRRMQGVPSFAIACGEPAGRRDRAGPGAAVHFRAGSADRAGVIANVVALAMASTAIAYRIYFRLIADIGPSRALTVTFLIPLFGVLWGFLFLGEALTIHAGGRRADRRRHGLALKEGSASATVTALRHRAEAGFRSESPAGPVSVRAVRDSAGVAADRRSRYFTCAACRQRCLMTSSFWSRGLMTWSGSFESTIATIVMSRSQTTEADMLVGDLAERAQPLHSLRPDLDLQDVGQPDAREDLVPRKGGVQQQSRQRFRHGSGSGAAAGSRARQLGRGQEPRRFALRSIARPCWANPRCCAIPGTCAVAAHESIGDRDREREHRQSEQNALRNQAYRPSTVIPQESS